VDAWPAACAAEYFQMFYLYQLLIYAVWFWFSYIFVAFFLGLVVVCSGLLNVHISRKNQRTIAKVHPTGVEERVEESTVFSYIIVAMQLTAYETECTVIRDGERRAVSSTSLVPGDALVVSGDFVLPCDLVLTRGSAVLDESGLTGESMPVRKVALVL
jgi:magnesium-transporting ATPase (P-type)